MSEPGAEELILREAAAARRARASLWGNPKPLNPEAIEEGSILLMSSSMSKWQMLADEGQAKLVLFDEACVQVLAQGLSGAACAAAVKA